MKRTERVNWLRRRKKGFLRHSFTTGLSFSIPTVIGGAYIQNDFYLDLFSQTSYRLYGLTVFGAILFSGLLWLSNDYLCKNIRNR